MAFLAQAEREQPVLGLCSRHEKVKSCSVSEVVSGYKEVSCCLRCSCFSQLSSIFFISQTPLSKAFNSPNMHISKYFTVVALIATGVLAAPPKPDKPNKPAQPATTVVSQTNQCGNGATPYCCNTDNSGKYTTCKTMSMFPCMDWCERAMLILQQVPAPHAALRRSAAMPTM